MASNLAALFVDVFDTPERHGDPFFKADKYLQRLDAYASRAGYELVAAQLDGELVGYMSGFTLAPDTAWWNGLEPALSAENAREDGTRTFAINELAVRKDLRQLGIGRRLIENLLGHRRESRATFCTEPHNALLQGLADRRGWICVGEQRPFLDAPVLYVYLRGLPL